MMSDCMYTALPLWQHNLHHSTLATAHVVKSLSESTNKSFIGLVQEPHLSGRGRIVGIPREIKVYADHGAQPRAAIFSFNNDLLFCPTFSGRDVSTCLMRLNDKMSIYISSVYLDILVNELPEPFRRLLDNSNGIQILAGIDTNAHSGLWGSPDTNTRGEWLEQVFFDNPLAVLNSGNTNTFSTSRASSIIDVTVCSDTLLNHLSGWHVSHEDYGSDHKRIEFVIRAKQPKYPRRWDIDNANWKVFQDAIEDRSSKVLPGEIREVSELDKQACKLTKDLNCSLLKATRWKPIRPGKVEIPWWTEELSSLRSQFKILQRNPDRYDDEVRLDFRRKYKSAIRKAKKQAYRQRLGNLESLKDTANFVKSLSRSRHELGMVKNPDGSYTSTKSELADAIFDKFFPGSNVCKADIACPKVDFSNNDASIVEELVTSRKVKTALATFGKKKAEGPDGFRPAVLQAVGEKTIARIVQLYKACLRLGHTPEIWRKSRVICIPKPGKSDYDLIKSWRPISLTSFLFKGLERIVYWHIEEHHGNLFHVNQHAFRKGCSTETALLSFVDKVESAILRKQFALACMLDISGAFDNLQPGKVHEAMVANRINPIITNWYTQYLYNRRAFVDIGSARYSRFLTLGTPQGGVLSPLAWNLSFNSLLGRLNQGPVKAIGYADDCAVIINGIHPDSMADILQQSIDEAIRWGADHGLSFSYEKSEAILFHRKQKEVNFKALKIHGHPISRPSTIKYLGITFDRKLSMNNHIESRITKCKQKLGMVRSAVGIRWGPRPKMMTWIYKAIILPALAYGAVTWGHRLDSRAIRHKKALKRLNRLALTCLGPMRARTPTDGLEIIADFLPPDLLIRSYALKAYQRWHHDHFSRGQWDRISRCSVRSTIRTWQDEIRMAGLPLVREDKGFSFNWKTPFKYITNGPNPSQDKVLLFTIVTDGNTGIISTTLQDTDTRAFTVNSATSQSQLICRLISLACSTAEDSVSIVPTNFNAAHFVLPFIPAELTNVVTRTATSTNCIMDLQRLLDKGIRISVEKRPSALTAIQPPEQILIPPQVGTFSDKTDQYCRKLWTKRWRSSTDCKQTRAWLPQPDPVFSKELLSLSRDEIGMIIQFITGHCWLRRHEAIVAQSTTMPTDCRLCGSSGDTHALQETPIHLATNCTATIHLARPNLPNSSSQSQIEAPVSSLQPSTLLHFLTEPLVQGLEGFQGRSNTQNPDDGQAIGGPGSI